MKKIIKRYYLYFLVLIFFVIQSCAEDEILNPEKEPPDPDPPQTNVRLVPQQYSSIQSAINTSNRNDTILVAPGTYYENINFIGKNIVVKSSGSSDNTIIDGSHPIDPNNSSVVKFVTAEDSITATLDGFTITGGSGSWSWPGKVGGGIWIENAQAVIKNCIIKNNAAVKGGGIYIGYDNAHRYLNNGILLNSVVIKNTSTYEGGGILGALDINYCTIAYNSSINGSALAKISSNTKISNSIIWEASFPLYSGWILNYCNIEGGWSNGVGNIDSDPMFCNTQLDNFHIASNSPCIGAGENGTTIGALGTCGQVYNRFDYPLAIGTYWKYNYQYDYSHFSEWSKRRGNRHWSIVDSTVNGNITQFRVRSINMDTVLSSYNPVPNLIIDTTYFYIDREVDKIVARPPSHLYSIVDNIEGYFNGNQSVQIGGRVYKEGLGLISLYFFNMTNTYYRELQQLTEFNGIPQ